MVVYKRSVCPFDCPDTCGLLVGVEKGKVVSVKGDPDHPFTRGAICVKVKHYGERVHSPSSDPSPPETGGGRKAPVNSSGFPGIRP
jgi:anaerobic selenocysteine-containing dehydrogenase